MTTVVRRATAADDQVVSDIICDGYRFLAGPDGITDEQLAGLVRAHPVARAAEIRALWECFVAEEDGQVVGMIAFADNEIQELWVRPHFHRRRIGSALFRVAEAAIRETGRARTRVHTTGYGTPFYQAMGMAVVGERACSMGPLKGRTITVLEKVLE